jgi:hypothetical protein
MHFLHAHMLPLSSGARYRAFCPISVTESTEPLVRCEFTNRISAGYGRESSIYGARRFRSGALQRGILRSRIPPSAVFVVVPSSRQRVVVELCSPRMIATMPKSRSWDATLKPAATKDGATNRRGDHSKRRISTGNIRAAARAGRSVAATQIATAAAAIQTASSPLEWNGT